MLKWLKNWLNPIDLYIKDKHYRIAEEYANLGMLPIEIIAGPFIGNIIIVENFVEGDNNIKYGQRLFKYNSRMLRGKYTDKFAKVVDDIVYDSMLEATRNLDEIRKEVLNDNAEDGNNFVEEFTSQRIVLSESSTLHKA